MGYSLLWDRSFFPFVILWFGFLCHVSSLRLSSGHSRLVLTIRINDGACTFLPIPTHCWQMRSIMCTSPLSVAVRFVCPQRGSKSPHRHACERGFVLCGNFSFFTTPSLGQVCIPKSFVSVFVFYILSYLLSKRLGCLSGCLVSCQHSEVVCGSCQHFVTF